MTIEHTLLFASRAYLLQRHGRGVVITTLAMRFSIHINVNAVITTTMAMQFAMHINGNAVITIVRAMQ
jgi:hypothetical protein